MANLNVLDAAAASKYLKTSGAGTDVDPHVPEHLDTNSAALLAAAQAIQTAAETLAGAISAAKAQVDVLTSALPSGAATAAAQAALLAELQAKADVNETQPVSAAALPLPSGAATDAKLDTTITALGTLLTELQAKADLAETQPVSGTLTANPSVVDVTPFAAAFATSGDNTVIAAPGAGNRLVIKILAAQNESAVATTILFKSGANTKRRALLQNQGDGASWAFDTGFEWRLGENEALVANLSGANSIGINTDSFVEAV